MNKIKVSLKVIVTIDPLEDPNLTLVATTPIKPKTRPERSREHIKAQRVAIQKKKHRYAKA